uniref:Uncharacterized protein n=1 Tax=Acrobeloides nanus TaxID=290746 RepID=A0A914EAS0_9BILA
MVNISKLLKLPIFILLFFEILFIAASLNGEISPFDEYGRYHNPEECIQLEIYQKLSYDRLNSKCFGIKENDTNFWMFTSINQSCTLPNQYCQTVPIFSDGNASAGLKCTDPDGRHYKIIEWAVTSTSHNGRIMFRVVYSMMNFFNEKDPQRVLNWNKMLCSYWLDEALQSLKTGKPIEPFEKKKIYNNHTSVNETISSLVIQDNIKGLDNQEYTIIHFTTNKGQLFRFIHEDQGAVFLTKTHNNEPMYDLKLVNETTLSYNTPYESDLRFRLQLPQSCLECVGLRHPLIGWDWDKQGCVYATKDTNKPSIWHNLVGGISNVCGILQNQVEKDKTIKGEKEEPSKVVLYEDNRKIINHNYFNITTDQRVNNRSESSTQNSLMEVITPIPKTSSDDKTLNADSGYSLWVWIPIAFVAGSVLMILVGLVVVLIYRKRKRQNQPKISLPVESKENGYEKNPLNGKGVDPLSNDTKIIGIGCKVKKL